MWGRRRDSAMFPMKRCLLCNSFPPPEQVISLASRPVSQVDLTLYLHYDATDSLNAAAASRSCCSLTHFSFQNLRAHLFIDSQKPPPFFFF